MKPFRIVGGLDVSPAQSEDNALAEARKRARPILRAWLRRVELYVMAGQLRSVDYMLAKEMCNYPSANQGRCYAGQERLGAAVAPQLAPLELRSRDFAIGSLSIANAAARAALRLGLSASTASQSSAVLHFCRRKSHPLKNNGFPLKTGKDVPV
jgi:hypothetical protein